MRRIIILSKTYVLENITDLCSDNGMKKPEFRLTEIKASMRFWWRALNYYKDRKEMKSNEDRIFGNADKIKSPIMLRLLNNINEFTDGAVAKKGHIVKISKKGVSCIKRFDPCKQVEIELSLYKRRMDKLIYTDKKLDYYSNLLEISLVLGGIGKRSRRGCGVFYLIENGNGEFSYKTLYENIKNNMKNLNVDQYYSFSDDEDKQYLTIIRCDNYKGLDYPYIEEINLSKKTIDVSEFYQKIKQAIDRCRNENVFYKYGDNYRLACPTYVTCYGRNDNCLYPIIVKLHNTSGCDDKKYYSIFKEVLL